MSMSMQSVLLLAVLSILIILPSISSGCDNNSKEIYQSVTWLCKPSLCKHRIGIIYKGYATVHLLCKRKNCENDTAYLKKTAIGWVVVESGTGIEPTDLIEDGFPKDVVEKLTGERLQ